MTNGETTIQHDALAGQRIVILGLARQGKALARFAASRGARVVVSDLRSAETLAPEIADLADCNIEYVLGEHPLTLLDGADVLAISGGVAADAPLVLAARARGVRLTNDSIEFQTRCRARAIGLTGSAGKSTTTSLIGAIGEAAGRRTWIGGNLGYPLIDYVDTIAPGDFVVQELSSFQLEIWQSSPSIAAILNITPNHLDRHKTMAVYTTAKANILRYQTADDVAVLPLGDLRHLEPLVQGRLRHFALDGAVQDGATVRGDRIVVRDGSHERDVCALADVQLRGRHNLANVLAAVVLADSAGIAPDAMRAAIGRFYGIAHRLERVATIDGVQYVNDSIATAPERAIAAIHSFDEPLVLLTGGRDKDLDWRDWARLATERARAIVLFGELADLVAPQLDSAQVTVVKVATLLQAVAAARDLARPGDVVLLAPGGTSFDAYRDFAERGDHFRALVAALAALATTEAIVHG